MCHLQIIVIDSVKTVLVLQAEDKNDSIDPGSKLEQQEIRSMLYTKQTTKNENK